MSGNVNMAPEAPEPGREGVDVLFSDRIAGSVIEFKFGFDEFIRGLVIPADLDITQTRIHSYGRQKPMLLSKIGKADWKTPRALKLLDGNYVVDDPARWFDIHMEVGLKRGLERLEVYTHYETSPWMPPAGLRAVVDASTIERHLRRRRDFIMEFAACLA